MAQILINIPDELIKHNKNDVLELSLEIDAKGHVTNIWNQEYGYKDLTFTMIKQDAPKTTAFDAHKRIPQT